MSRLLLWLVERLHRQTIRKSPVRIPKPATPKPVRLHEMQPPVAFLEAWTGFYIQKLIARQRTNTRRAGR